MGQVSSTYHLVCMWRVEMKREKSIKGEGSNEKEGSEICKRKHYSNLNHICNHFHQYILEHTSSDCARDKFTQITLFYFCLRLSFKSHSNCCLIHQSLVFQSTLYKFIVFGLLGLDPIILWARIQKCVPTIFNLLQ